MFTTTNYGIDLINSNRKEFRYDLVWHKGSPVGFLSANIKPMRDHEMMYVFSKKGAYYNRVDIPNGIKARSERKQERKSPGIYGVQLNVPKKDPTARCVASVVFTPSEKGKGIHPTQKPKELYKWLIDRYCPADGTMLDPTAGSFNSVFTALEMGRDAIGIEKDEGFFMKAKKKAMAYSDGGL
jgi:site-specific DNA-methyltransferase (adenine-specific)